MHQLQIKSVTAQTKIERDTHKKATKHTHRETQRDTQVHRERHKPTHRDTERLKDKITDSTKSITLTYMNKDQRQLRQCTTANIL